MLRVLNQELPGCRIEPGVLVVDLGANRGRFSRLAAARGARVIALEPLPIAAEAADRELRGFPNTLLLRAAAGDRLAIVNLHQHVSASDDPLGHSISASTFADKPNVDASRVVQVLSVPLGDLLDSLGSVYLLKVDIEGGELAVWPAIRSRSADIQFLLMELHDFSQAHRDLAHEIEMFIRDNDLEDRWSLNWI